MPSTTYCSAILAAKNIVDANRVEEDYRQNNNTAIEEKSKRNIRCGGVSYSDGIGHHKGPEHHPKREVRREKEQYCQLKRQLVTPCSRALHNTDQGRDGENRESDSPMSVSQITLSNGACVDRKRHKERKAQREDYSADKPGYARVCPIAQCPLALQDKPSRAKQGITEHQPDPGQHRKWMQPTERVAGVLVVGDRNASHHRANGRALNKRYDDRAEKEAPIPEPSHAAGAVEEFKRDAAEDQAEQHQSHRQVESAEENGIDDR